MVMKELLETPPRHIWEIIQNIFTTSKEYLLQCHLLLVLVVLSESENELATVYHSINTGVDKSTVARLQCILVNPYWLPSYRQGGLGTGGVVRELLLNQYDVIYHINSPNAVRKTMNLKGNSIKIGHKVNIFSRNLQTRDTTRFLRF